MDKKCSKCQIVKPATAGFFPLRNKKKQLSSWCRKCHSQQSTIRNRRSPEARAAARLRTLKSRRGINLDQYNTMLLRQDGQCAICSTRETNAKGTKERFCVDHDHITGKIRGLLCFRCNTAIGLLRDSSSFAQKAVEYLKKHEI